MCKVSFLSLSIWACMSERGGLFPAVSFYLTAERHARAARKNYFLGLVYTRLGEVYSEQMNYEGMLEYYRKALSHFRLLGNTSLQNSAQLNLANAYFSLKDTTNARKYYAAALSLARKRADDEIFAVWAIWVRCTRQAEIIPKR